MPKLTNVAPIYLRGRLFSESDLSVIDTCIRDHFDLGRTQISRSICERLNWRQPNGWLKDRACRDVLLRLQELGAIELPPRQNNPSHKKKKDLTVKQHSILKGYDFSTKVEEFPQEIELVFSKGNTNEKIWNAIINKDHYLGHSVIVGRCIKYLLTSKTGLVGAICFSSSSWSLKPRDDLLTAIGIDNPRDYTINNARFLILPHINVKNLASHVLAIATRQIVHDWASYYSITPLVSETFVLPSKFEGTCYKAANWIDVGTTKGYSKKGTSHPNSQEPKKIFLYGLNRNIRRRMRRAILENQE